jgi:hypothetical protein
MKNDPTGLDTKNNTYYVADLTVAKTAMHTPKSVGIFLSNNYH